MQVNPYLFYNGNCEAAFKYYEKVLGAKIEALLTHEQAPESMPVPPDWKKKIMHAKLTIDGEIIMASDAPPGHYHQPQGYSVSLHGRGRRRWRTQVQGAGRRRQRQHALQQDVLGQGLWHVRRPVRDSLDGQLPGGRDVILNLPLPVLHGERVGVRGGFRKFERCEFAEQSPSPEFAHGANATFRRKRGEVTQSRLALPAPRIDRRQFAAAQQQ